MTGLLLEIRWSSLRWWFLPLLAVDLGMIFARQTYWIGVWPQASAAAQIPALLLAPLSGAASVWAASRLRRTGTGDLLDRSAKAAWKVETVSLLGSLVVALIPYGLGVLLAGLVSIPLAGSGFLWPGYLWLGGVLIVGSVTFGHAVGRCTRSPAISAMAVAFTVLLANFYFAGTLGMYYADGSPDRRIAMVPAVARILPVSVLACLIVTIRPRSWRLRHPNRQRTGQWPKLVLGAVAIVLSFFAISLSGPTAAARTPPSTPVCTHGSVKICFWPEENKYLPAAQQMAERVAQLPHDVLTIPSRYYEFGLRGNDPRKNDFYIQEGDLWGVADSIALHIAIASDPPFCGAARPADQRRVLHAEWTLQLWLATRVFGAPRPSSIHGGPPGVNIREVAAVATWSQARQVHWARTELSIAREVECPSE